MKATVIVSTEYYLNQPKVFVNVGRYYMGDPTYYTLRKRPPVEYWNTATSSDSDRYFNVREVEVSEEQVIAMIDRHILISNLRGQLIDQKTWYPIRTYKIKRGKAWEEYCKNYQEYEADYLRVMNHNTPILSNIITLEREQRNTIKDL